MIALLGVVGTLTLQTFEPSATLPLESEPCARGVVARASQVVGTTRVTVVHDCAGDVDARSGRLAIRSGERWFIAPNGLVDLERVSSGIIRRVTFVREHVSSGELADGTKAVLYTIETMNGTSGSLRFGRVLVCSLGTVVACGEGLAFACDADSCTAPRLSRGTLILSDADDGEQRWAVSVLASEPRR